MNGKRPIALSAPDQPLMIGSVKSPCARVKSLERVICSRGL